MVIGRGASSATQMLSPEVRTAAPVRIIDAVDPRSSAAFTGWLCRISQVPRGSPT